MAKLLYLGNSDPMGLKLSISDEEMSRILSIYDKKKKKKNLLTKLITQRR